MYTALAGLHYEFKPLGVYVTGTGSRVYEQAVLEKCRPRSEDHAVETDERRAVAYPEAFSGLCAKTAPKSFPGRLNRILTPLSPYRLARKMEAGPAW